MEEEPICSTKIIRARNGRGYKCFVEIWDDFIRFNVKENATIAARATCSLVRAQVWNLDEFFVFDEAKYPQASWKDFLDWKPKTINFRGEGIGSALLELMINELRNNNVREIIGNVVERDMQTMPHLINWYRKKGFTVSDPMPDDLTNAVARLSILL